MQRNYAGSRRSSRASSFAEREAEIAALRAIAGPPPVKMSARSAYVVSEIEKVLDMSARLYDNDHDANRARRTVEIARLRG